MVLTIESLLDNKGVLSAIIDRATVNLLEMDKVFWKDYLNYDRANPDGTFKTYIGNQTGVIAGTVIDRYANKPIRKRHALGSGVGEVACFGDAYQMDNTRLERLQILINTYNNGLRAAQPGILNEIINFLADDMRQCMLAPMKRLDLIMGDLRFKGQAAVNAKENKRGVSIADIKLPVTIKQAKLGDKNNILTWMTTEFVDKMRPMGYSFATAEMNRATFYKRIVSSSEFIGKYTMKFGDMEFSTGNIVTEAMANRLLEATDIPFRFRVKDEWVQVSETESKNAVPDDYVSFLPALGANKLGYMKWKEPYEMRDPIPGRTYTTAEDGKMFISSYRNSEGRFMEYGMEAIPDIEIPNKMAIADLTQLG